ncbi:MAG: hypothetical protein KC492_24720, partial [Myxococcales bacterium]|nr:hypothetical protein [Myxococcales bacterium]
HHRRPPDRVLAKEVAARAWDDDQTAAQGIYHFLLLDPGMSPFDSDKAITELAPDEVKLLKEWRKGLTAKYTEKDKQRLAALSKQVELLYARAARERGRLMEKIASRESVWGQPEGSKNPFNIAAREKMLALLKQPGTAYSRLKQAMDLWCALWAWPLEQAALLPSRTQFWSLLEGILGVSTSIADLPDVTEQLELIPSAVRPSEPPPAPELEGDVKAEDVLSVAAQAAASLRPLHWELEFSEVFVQRGGFDLTVGNPPWIRLDWSEAGVLSDIDPRIELDGLSASDIAKRRTTLVTGSFLSTYLEAAIQVLGTQAFLGAVSTYPVLAGVRTNLYKCFIATAWRIGSGIVGLVHQDGLFDDPHGGVLRAALYSRLRLVAQFKNELVL